MELLCYTLANIEGFVKTKAIVERLKLVSLSPERYF